MAGADRPLSPAASLHPKVPGDTGGATLGGRGQPKGLVKVLSPGEKKRARLARIASGITSAVPGVGHGWVHSPVPCVGGAVQRILQRSAVSPRNRFDSLRFCSLRQHYYLTPYSTHYPMSSVPSREAPPSARARLRRTRTQPRLHQRLPHTRAQHQSKCPWRGVRWDHGPLQLQHQIQRPLSILCCITRR